MPMPAPKRQSVFLSFVRELHLMRQVLTIGLLLLKVNSWRCKIPYFSIDNVHLMYSTHPKLFTLYFYLSFVITFDLPLIPF